MWSMAEFTASSIVPASCFEIVSWSLPWMMMSQMFLYFSTCRTQRTSMMSVKYLVTFESFVSIILRILSLTS